MMVRVYDAHPHPDELADERNDDVEPLRWDVALFAASAVLGAVLLIAIVLCAVEAAPFFKAVVEDITARPEACRAIIGAECIAAISEGYAQ
ncbi:hypothetical protein [Paracoccus yeei]|uniref:hypothetical protein n=1 Tax=Paracoccus yeei TaxID=147645 RepID=UPI001C8F0F90|nr:hypothetical protein [Paracoccus yeei]MBY0137503.1 hypothetical protein [Paracoccus yeei]